MIELDVCEDLRLNVNCFCIDIDGFLSFEEFKHGGNEKFLKTAEKRFQTLDTNQDKKVSLDELKSRWASMTRNKTN